MTTQARVLAGRYRMESLLGVGGMGEVWQGYDEVLGRPVAIKEVRFPPELPAEEADVLRRRFLREASLTAQLNHPGIVTVHDVVMENGRPYLVMELLRPYTLADLIDERGPLPAERVAAIGLELLAALTVAHRAGVVHRDVKPGNVLIREDGNVVLTDFGIAMSERDPVLTDTGVLIGSPTFMAPERLRGEDVGPPADLWSLGATLYAAVEAHPPFRADTVMGTISSVLTDEPEPTRVDGPLRDALVGMLTKDPTWRLTRDQARILLQRAAVPESASHQAGDRTQQLAGAPAPLPTPTGASPYAVGSHRSEHRGRRVLGVLVGGLAVAALVTAGVVATDRLTGPPTTANPDTGPTQAPDGPFDSPALAAFSRRLFDPAQCVRAERGTYRVLDQILDAEAVACADDTYAGKFFRSPDLDTLEAERDLYRSKATPGSTSPVAPPLGSSTGLYDGRRFSFLLAADGTARLYWDSAACLCGGILAAPDDDVPALERFWRGD